MPGFTYGLDVVVLVGHLHLGQHQTVDEVHQVVQERLTPLGVSISRREILYLFDAYCTLLRAASSAKQDRAWLAQVKAKGGIIVSVDGIQPDRGNETIYLVRDALTGRVLAAENVTSSEAVTNVMVAHHFDRWRQELAHQLTEGGLSEEQQQCLEQFLQVLSNPRAHLIQCYDRQSFPRTNNDMERRIRGLKTRYRRISGGKNWNSYLLRYGRCVAYYDWWEQDAQRSCQFLHQAAQLDRAQWRKHRRESRAATSEQLKRFRFRRKRQVYLAALEARWAAAAPTSFLP